MTKQATILQNLRDGQQELVTALVDLMTYHYKTDVKLGELVKDNREFKKCMEAGFEAMGNRFDHLEDRLDKLEASVDMLSGTLRVIDRPWQ